MHSALAFSLFASFAAALPTASDQAVEFTKHIVARAPPEANAQVLSHAFSGTGCPSAGSASFFFGGDSTVAYGEVIVEAANPAKNCKVTIDLQVAPDWKYTINKRSVTRGFAQDVSANVEVVFKAGGHTSTNTNLISLAASHGGKDYSAERFSDGATSAYGGGVATIDVSVNFLSGAGILTVDSLDTEFAYSK